MADVVFSVFDERAGPVAIFSTIKDSLLTKKIAVRSIVSTLTSVRNSSSERLEGEAIIPFPDENRIAFIYYTSLDQKTEGGEHRVVSLSCVIENEKISILYSNATSLSQSAVNLKQLLNRSYRFGEPLSSELKEQIKKWAQLDETQEAAIIAEKKIKFGLKSMFELFPVKSGFRSYEDPLAPVFFGVIMKIPVVLAGPNVEFLLEISDLLRCFMPEEELDIRLSVPLDYQSSFIASKIPRADLVLLNNEQDKRKMFYRDPVITAGIGKESKFVNYIQPTSALRVFEGMLKKAREFSDDIVANHYLEGEFQSFFSKLEQLKKFCLTGQQARIKDISRRFDVSEDYIIALAEALRTRNEISAQSINKMFRDETNFEKMEIFGQNNIGFIR
ncbi:MAG: hypothetical protein ACTSPG_00015 [Candidatus Hodarchaeales archaeon]